MRDKPQKTEKIFRASLERGLPRKIFDFSSDVERSRLPRHLMLAGRILLLEREFVIQPAFIPQGDEFLLDGVTNGDALVLAVEPR